MLDLRWSVSEASAEAIERHLAACDKAFVPALSTRVRLGAYARKLHSLTARVEVWLGNELIGLVAVYCNDVASGVAFISNVSVLPERQGQGLAAEMLRQCIEHCKAVGMRKLELHVDASNTAAVRLYERAGFTWCSNRWPTSMSQRLEGE